MLQSAVNHCVTLFLLESLEITSSEQVYLPQEALHNILAAKWLPIAGFEAAQRINSTMEGFYIYVVYIYAVRMTKADIGLRSKP